MAETKKPAFNDQTYGALEQMLFQASSNYRGAQQRTTITVNDADGNPVSDPVSGEIAKVAKAHFVAVLELVRSQIG
jgi:hypothetical protein